MATLAPRHPEMLAFHELSAMVCFGRGLQASVEADICVSCGESATEFSNEVNATEYTISGMCETCQDEAFDNSVDDGLEIDPEQRGQLPR